MITEEARKKGIAASLKSRQLTALRRAREVQSRHANGWSIKRLANFYGVKPRTISRDLKKDLSLLINNEEIKYG